VDADDLSKTLAPVGSSLVGIAANLVDGAWGTSRPTRTANAVTPLPVRFSGHPTSLRPAWLVLTALARPKPHG
jgi:Xaa-Pro aminopeptidase